ncbi:protein toll [Plakobranchus ocellatus]|uniref:Protein toll n=1 Tax=Plakobranchus ocellatus TaxID=259542 RepID=A0AAV3ZCA4_9GAST|nr:protein toll [Plakobranchus ocellatus]
MGSIYLYLSLVLVLFIAAAARSNEQYSYCGLRTCSCGKTEEGIITVEDVSCRLMAITSEDDVVLALKNQPIKSLRLKCLSLKIPSVINSATIGGLSTLESLHLENCNFSSGLSRDSFEGLGNLATLSISHSVLPESPENNEAESYLSPISHLENLSLTECNLTQLPALSEWSQLRYLNVSYNNLKTLHFVQVSQTVADTTADTRRTNQENSNGQVLGNDPVEVINGGSHREDVEDVSSMRSWNSGHDSPTGVKILDISYNPLTSLPSEAIALCPKLERLLMQGLSLAEFDLPESVELPDLISMDARDSRLKVFDFKKLGSSRNMQELHLAGAGMPLEVQGLSSLTSLVNLTLGNLGLNSSIWEQLLCPHLSRLNLTSNNITSVDTSRLPKLRFLCLDRNQLSEVDAFSSFGNLPELQYLNISYNQIPELPASTFRGTWDLKAFDISHNNLSRIESNTFHNLSNLMYLGLAHNQISSMGYLLFERTPSLKWLFVQHNKLTLLPKLNSLEQLLWLNVSFNQVMFIEPRHLDGLTSLITIHANDNSLKKISPNLFSKTPNLKEAWFQNNEISVLGNLGRHEHLLYLRLGSNRIPDFGYFSPFLGLSSLQLLSLDNNFLTNFRSNSFPPSLRFLFISLNHFSFLGPYVFDNLPKLEHVQLMYNRNLLSLPASAVSRFASNSPKPLFLVRGNVWICDCNMAYLNVMYETRQRVELFQKFYAVFEDLDTTICAVDYETKALMLRPFVQVPLSDFVCSYPDLFCDGDCKCCDVSKNHSSPVDLNCPCQLTCPLGCTCYIGGETIVKTYYHVRCDGRGFSMVPDRIPMRATNLYVDGNNISTVSNYDFHWQAQLENLYLNSTSLRTIEEGAFENCTSLLTLYLDHNLLTTINSTMFVGLSSLVLLYLNDNDIDAISADSFESLVSVQLITLHNNRLQKLSSPLASLSPSLEVLTLSGNPWRCDCEESKPLRDLIHVRTKAIFDKDQVCCYLSHDQVSKSLPASVLGSNGSETGVSTKNTIDININFDNISLPQISSEITTGSPFIFNVSHTNTSNNEEFFSGKKNISDSSICRPILKLNFAQICARDAYTIRERRLMVQGSGMPTVIIILIILTAFLCLVALLVIFAIFKRKELQALAFVKLGVRVFDKKIQLDKTDAGTKAFDAFISYSSKDDEFVAGTLVPALEDANNGYRICVHYRDFPVGRTITDTICRAIECSSRTILLLTQNFLKSEWCRFEFQAAHRHILKEGSHRLIIVIKGDVPEEMLDADLAVHLKSRSSFLKFEDPWFWEKLYFSLPDIRQRRAREAKQEKNGAAGGGGGDGGGGGAGGAGAADGGGAQAGGKRAADAMTVIKAMRVLAGQTLEDIPDPNEAVV